MGDLLTILRSLGPRLTKLWQTDGTIKSYDRARNFYVEQATVSSVRDLAEILSTLEAEPDACVIRAAPKPDCPRPTRRLLEHFEDKPLHTVLIEVDEYRPLLSDPLDGEDAALEYISECLPKPFQGASFWWQLSASAGAVGKERLLKLHIWMWLETPYDSGTLRAWATTENLELDRAVLQPTQIHYTAAPVIEDGVDCPVKVRSGLHVGARDSVPLVIDTEALSIRSQGVRQRGERRDVDDALADYVEGQWETWGELSNGGIKVSCPWDDNHSGGVKGDSSSTYFPAGTNGYSEGAYVCFHDGCRERGRGEFATAIGYVDSLFSDLAERPGTPTATKLGAITAAALMGQVFEPVSWVVDGIIPAGLTILAGKPKLGKSWLMLDVSVATASGGEVLNRRCDAGDVLYCALEDNHRRLKERMSRLCRSKKWPERLTFWTEMSRIEEGGLEQLRGWIAGVERPRLIVIDVFAKVRRAMGAKEGVYDSDYRAVSPLKQLADEFGVAVVVVHHLRKMAADDDPLDAVSGSTGLTGAADTILALNRRSQGVTLYGRGRDVEEIDVAVEFDRNACRWMVLGDTREVYLSAERSAIIEALRGAAEPLGPRDISDVTGHPYANTRRLLHLMIKDGSIQRPKHGKYAMP